MLVPDIYAHWKRLAFILSHIWQSRIQKSLWYFVISLFTDNLMLKRLHVVTDIYVLCLASYTVIFGAAWQSLANIFSSLVGSPVGHKEDIWSTQGTGCVLLGWHCEGNPVSHNDLVCAAGPRQRRFKTGVNLSLGGIPSRTAPPAPVVS